MERLSRMDKRVPVKHIRWKGLNVKIGELYPELLRKYLRLLVRIIAHNGIIYLYKYVRDALICNFSEIIYLNKDMIYIAHLEMGLNTICRYNFKLFKLCIS